MISFIIIGRNEGWKLTKCFKSVFKAIEHNKLKDYEVIYVDSKSTDNSIERAKQFPNIRIFQITGDCNAAIGRNIGAKEAQGDIFFFIDGDMEINLNFLKKYLVNQKNYPCITGQVVDYIHNQNWNFLKTSYHNKRISSQRKVNSTGGVFIIKTNLWKLSGGMRTKYKRGQDLDFSLSLSKKGYRILRIPDVICIHHTISHSDENRMWQNIANLNVFYNKSVLFRDHFLNKYLYKSLLRKEYTMLIMFLSALLAIFIHPAYLIVYFIAILLRSASNTKKSFKVNRIYFFKRLAYYIIKDFLVIMMFFIFFPKNKKIRYKEL